VPHVEDQVIPEKPTEKVITLIELLRSCVEIMKDETTLSTLYDMIDESTRGKETPIIQRMVNQVLHRKRTNEEYKFIAYIGMYDVDNVILKLGSDAKVFPKKKWDLMGKRKLVWYPVKLSLTDEHNIVPIGCLTGVPMNVDEVRNMVEFEAIEIMEDSQPYCALMGLEWDFDNHAIINLKWR
jgi:hypothetical protein